MVLGFIAIVVAFISLMITSQTVRRAWLRLIALILAMETASIAMIIYAGTFEARVTIGILLQAMIVFAFFARMYAEADRTGVYSEIYNMDNRPGFLQRISQMDCKSQHRRCYVYASISAVLWLAAIVVYFILDFAYLPNTFPWLFVGGSLSGVSLIYMIVAIPQDKHAYCCVNSLVSCLLIIAIGFSICGVIDKGSKSDESAEQYTVVSYELRPIEESVFFRSGEPYLYDADSPGQVHYLATKASIASSGSGYFFLSEKSNNLQYIDKDDISFEYQADAQPKLIERRTWHITKYWRRFKQSDDVDYHVILPSKDYVLE